MRLEIDRTFTSADGDVAIEGRYVGTNDGPVFGPASVFAGAGGYNFRATGSKQWLGALPGTAFL